MSAPPPARGVSVVEILQGRPPRLHKALAKGNYAKLVQRREMFQGLPRLSKECVNFLDRALQIYPERRISASDALSHDWLKGKDERPPPPGAVAGAEDLAPPASEGDAASVSVMDVLLPKKDSLTHEIRREITTTIKFNG